MTTVRPKTRCPIRLIACAASNTSSEVWFVELRMNRRGSISPSPSAPLLMPPPSPSRCILASSEPARRRARVRGPSRALVGDLTEHVTAVERVGGAEHLALGLDRHVVHAGLVAERGVRQTGEPDVGQGGD